MAALPLMEMVFLQLAKAAPALLTAIPDLMLASGAAATIAGSAGSGSVTSATPPSITPSPPAVVSTPGASADATPGSNGTSSSSIQTIQSQFPNNPNFNHPYLMGPRETMNLYSVRNRFNIEAPRHDFDFDAYDRILSQEYMIIARYFGLTPDLVRSSNELSALALPAVSGRGDLFTESSAATLVTPRVLSAANALRGRAAGSGSFAEESKALSGNAILRDAFSEAKDALEIKNEMPIPASTFATMAAAARVTPSRVSRAYQAVASRIRDRETIKRVLSKWLYNKLLPGMAGAGVTWALNKAFTSAAPTSYNVEMTPDKIEQAATERELDIAFADLGFADVFSVLPDADQPGEGLAHWTPNPVHSYGIIGSVMPRKSSVYPVAPALPRSLDPVLGQRLTGDSLSERSNDSRAKRLRTSLEVPAESNPTLLPTAQPSDLSVDDSIVASKMVSPETKGHLRPTHRVNPIPRLQDRPETSQRELTQNFDPTFAQSVPSTVTGASSSRPEEYTGTNRPYKQTLTEAPNIVGLGYDESQTERFLMDMVTSDESKLPPVSGDGQVVTGNAAPINGPHMVSVADTTNPIFANVGVPAPTETPQPSVMPRQL